MRFRLFNEQEVRDQLLGLLILKLKQFQGEIDEVGATKAELALF